MRTEWVHIVCDQCGADYMKRTDDTNKNTEWLTLYDIEFKVGPVIESIEVCSKDCCKAAFNAIMNDNEVVDLHITRKLTAVCKEREDI